MQDPTTAETVRITGHDDDKIEAYASRTLAEGRFGVWHDPPARVTIERNLNSLEELVRYVQRALPCGSIE